jgi:hypothetical protein
LRSVASWACTGDKRQSTTRAVGITPNEFFMSASPPVTGGHPVSSVGPRQSVRTAPKVTVNRLK